MKVSLDASAVLRILRIAIGVSILLSIPGSGQPILLGILGSIITMQGVFNLGCGMNRCNPKSTKNFQGIQEEVTFEEVK